MTKLTRRILGGCAGVVVALSTVACAQSVDGAAVYAPDVPRDDLPLVKIAELRDLVPTPEEARTVIDAPTLIYLMAYTKPDSLPQDTLSEPECASAVIPNDVSAYRGSGYAAVYGRLADDLRSQRISTGVAAFAGAEEAHEFVTQQVERWRECTDRTLTVSLGGQELQWTTSGPTRAEGVHVLLRRQEGVDYACSRGVAARANVAADVLVCGRDAEAVNPQAGKLANLMLAKIPE
ncbi:sensor domain-containing protein [Mycolicibacterium thermoresistibile]